MVEPNIVVNTGASATIGIALAASTTGVVSSAIEPRRRREHREHQPEQEARDQADQRVAAGHRRGREDHRELRDELLRDRGGRGQQERGHRRRPPRPAATPRATRTPSTTGASRPRTARRPAAAVRRSAGRRRRSQVPLAQRLAHRRDRREERAVSRTSSTSSGSSSDRAAARAAPPVDDLGDPARARRHHHDPVGQHDRLRDGVRDEQHRRAASRPRSAAARPASARGSSRPARRTARPSAAASAAAASARAIATRCCMPPESCPGRDPAKSASPTSSSSSAARARRSALPTPCTCSGQLDVLRDRPPLQQPGLLERDPVVLVEPGLPGGLAADAHRARARLLQVGDHPQQRRLPAPRRADQRHELAVRRGSARCPRARGRRRTACRRRPAPTAAGRTARGSLIRSPPGSATARGRAGSTAPAATRPSTAAPRMAAYSCDGSPVAVCAYSMISLPMPPRVPVEISATIAPTTAAAAASRTAGMSAGTAAGQPQPQQRGPPARGQRRNSSTSARPGRGEPAQRADRDGEERQVRRDHHDARPRLPRPPHDRDLAAPARDQRGDRDQRHGLRRDDVGQHRALRQPEPQHHQRQHDAEHAAEHEAAQREAEGVQGALGDGRADRADVGGARHLRLAQPRRAPSRRAASTRRRCGAGSGRRR